MASDLELVIEYMDEILSVIDMEKLLSITAEFLVHKFKLSNCSFWLKGNVWRQYSNSRSTVVYDSIEQALWLQISELKMPIIINSLKDDAISKQIENLALVASSVASFPLVSSRNMIGMCCIYCDDSMQSNSSVISTVLEKFSKAIQTAENYSIMQHSAVTDKLTKLFNRAYFMEALKQEILRANENNVPTSLILFDIDNFKNYNDTNGHQEGDRLLVELANIMRQNVRASDIAGRYGGEEFILILPGLSAEGAFKRAEALREEVQKKTNVTISIGLVTCMNSSVQDSAMIREADRALYKAKNTGKNRTVNFLIIDKALGVIDVQDANCVGKS